MNKSIVMAVVLTASMLFAQEKANNPGGTARTISLGGSTYVEDITNLTINPAYGGVYTNYVFGDIGSTSTPFGNDGVSRYVGVNFKVTENLTLGGLLSSSDSPFATQIIAVDPFNAINNVPIDNNIELMGSYKFDNIIAGLGVAFMSSSQSSEDVTGTLLESSASQFGINAGVILPLGSVKLDVATSLIFLGETVEPKNVDKNEVNQTIFSINTRAFWGLSKKVELVPTFNFTTASGEVKVGTMKNNIPTLTQVSAGLGMNYRVGEILLTGGPSVVYMSAKRDAIKDNAGTQLSPSLTNSITVFPAWNLGAEWNLTSWLTGRLGYDSYTLKLTNETPDNATDKTTNKFVGHQRGNAYAGLGFKISNFNIEAVVNSDVLRQGLNNIGGGGATFAYLSASLLIE